MIDSSPVSSLNRRARCFKMVGPYVSGKKKKSGHVTAAKITPIQKAQLQETTLMKPEMGGPRIGPKVVAACTHHQHTHPSSSWTNTYHKNRHTPTPTNRIMINIRTDSSHNTNRTTPTHPYQQPKHYERRKIRAHSRRNRENRENHKRRGYRPFAAIRFGYGAPDHGTPRVTDKVDGSGQDELRFGGYGEVRGDGGCCACSEGGGHGAVHHWASVRLSFCVGGRSWVNVPLMMATKRAYSFFHCVKSLAITSSPTPRFSIPRTHPWPIVRILRIPIFKPDRFRRSLCRPLLSVTRVPRRWGTQWKWRACFFDLFALLDV